MVPVPQKNGGGWTSGLFGAFWKVAVNTVSSAAGTGTVLGLPNAMAPTIGQFEQATMLQPSIKDTLSLINIDMGGSTSFFVITAVMIILTIALTLC